MFFLTDLFVGFATTRMGSIFLVNSETRRSLILNALALRFILDIEILIARRLPANIGIFSTIHVPERVGQNVHL